jgi:hypothetical protein
VYIRYFSSIFAASKHFPDYPGFASGLTMALFGLSPLFLSVIASDCFIDPTSGLLDVVLFLRFLAVLTASTHVLGYFVLRMPTVANPSVSVADYLSSDSIDENSTLLPRKNVNQTNEPLDSLVVERPHPIWDWSFWLLGLYCFLIIGAVSAF